MEKVAWVLFAFLIACSSDEPKCKRHCMSISNSNPVQFWINGEETYNEKVTPGITKVCWCQPFECNDEIKVSFIDEAIATNAININLNIFDSSDNLLESIPFSVNVPDYAMNVTFIPADYDLCDTSVKLQVSYDRVSYRTPLDPLTFTNIADGHTSWTISAHTSVTYPSLPNLSNRLHIPLTVPFSEGIQVAFNISATSGSGSQMTAVFRKAGVEISNTVTFNTFSTSNISLQNFVLTDSPDELVLLHTGIPGPGSVPVTFAIQTMDLYEVSGEIYGNSDCLNISEVSSSPTVLIAYSNNSIFDGINFHHSSPNDFMYLRIPGIFFHTDNPVTQEDIELSDGNIVRLYTKVEGKTLLQIGMMPHYMHTKLILALSSDQVIIDGKDWLMRDEYQKSPGNLKYPLKTATVLLTDKSFVKENQLS